MSIISKQRVNNRSLSVFNQSPLSLFSLFANKKISFLSANVVAPYRAW